MTRRAIILVEGDPTGNILPYAQAARRLGLHPIILSSEPAQYDWRVAESIEAIRVDTNDLDALTRECSRLRSTYEVAGITCAKEWVCAAVAKLCKHFDLPGPSPASIERCCDKFTQRRLLAEAGVPVPAYRLATNATDVEHSAAEIGLPVILKPAVGNGSSGVRLCRNVDDLIEHTAYLLGGKHIWRSSPKVLVEEFANGPYYGAYMMGDELIGICAAEFDPPPHFVFREWTFPASLTEEQHERIADLSRSCLRALGLGWGPAGVEVRWTKRGPVVIEVNPRLAGAPDPQMVQLACGVDLVTEHIKLVLGDRRNRRRRHSQTVVARYLVPDRDGILDRIDGESQAAAVPGVVEVKLCIEPKTPIARKGDYRDCIGYIVAASPDLAETKMIAQRGVDLISWSITPFATRGSGSGSGETGNKAARPGR
ncbi:acetyl-CoA carboxylase biotin carboxylase subunit family protein [Mesorhizobium sp. M0145]|uniref:ATP-grasp domain-containing protein n=1 Tax=Mesorhizobium sp. M0145 TaxID=2956895 RepID=UPI0033381A89